MKDSFRTLFSIMSQLFPRGEGRVGRKGGVRCRASHCGAQSERAKHPSGAHLKPQTDQDEVTALIPTQLSFTWPDREAHSAFSLQKTITEQPDIPHQCFSVYLIIPLSLRQVTFRGLVCLLFVSVLFSPFLSTKPTSP